MLTSEELEVLKSRIAGRRIIASISGGKDSAAMSLHLTELGLEHDRVFLDTGWEHPATYDYLRGPLTAKLGPILELKNDRYPEGMSDLIRTRGMFPSRTRRFCTQELKVYPLAKYINARIEAGEDILNVVGIRAAESEARSKMPAWEWQDGFDCEVWRPLLSWSEQDVIDTHKRHGLTPHPFYLQRNASRIGCYPCLFARKGEIRAVADNDPWRIGQIAALEEELKPRSTGTSLPTFFQALGALRTGGPVNRGVPILEVVDWSRTKRGGKEFEPFAAGERDAGCMRWGMCDTNPQD